MNIMIVDDEKEILKDVENKVLDYASRKMDETVRIVKKDSEYDVWEYMKKGQSADIIFMDIRLKDDNGIELAKQIQEYNDETKIVFITGYDDYYMQIFDADPISFIRKPILQEHIDKVMDKIIVRKDKEIGSKISFKVGTVLHVQDINKVLYMEALGKKTRVVTLDNEYMINKSFGEMEEEIGDKLIKCHRSYMINVDRVKEVSKYNVVMYNDDVVSLSRKQYNAIFKLYCGGELDEDN